MMHCDRGRIFSDASMIVHGESRVRLTRAAAVAAHVGDVDRDVD